MMNMHIVESIRLPVVTVVALFASLCPMIAQALTLPQAIGFFHIAVGIILTGIVLLFITGFGVYIARFNTWPTHRDTAIRVLEWAVVMLFVLIVVLAIVNAIQHHGNIVLPILAFLILIIVAIVAIFAFRTLASAKKKPPPARR